MFQILIVEDDKELSQLFQKVLEKNGYQVKSASDGAQALEVLDKEYIGHFRLLFICNAGSEQFIKSHT